MTTLDMQLAAPPLQRRQRPRKLRTAWIIHASPRCVYCGTLLAVDDRGDVAEPGPRIIRKATIDHVVPRSRGGTDDPANLAPACAHCNQAKGDRTLDEWLADLIEARKRIRLHQLAHLQPGRSDE